ncbi:hypothetical protein NDU88_001001 [Pleurodeles waltl]|uniref:Uncharacterized protein n=1 Tax=Pleurodeles waltl TaxID=8319 RepID=A0AAV7VAM8_PLEWA|nr:hypothetical protein NDU88_001001 [Pleurodeles waltl]
MRLTMRIALPREKDSTLGTSKLCKAQANSAKAGLLTGGSGSSPVQPLLTGTRPPARDPPTRLCCVTRPGPAGEHRGTTPGARRQLWGDRGGPRDRLRDDPRGHRDRHRDRRRDDPGGTVSGRGASLRGPGEAEAPQDPETG